MKPKSKKNPRKISFATPLIALFIIILSTAFGLQSCIVSNHMEEEIRSIQKENFINLTKSLKDLLDMELKANEKQLEAYATSIGQILTNSASQEEMEKSIDELLANIKSSNRFYETLFISNDVGNIEYSSDSSILGADITDREYFQATILAGMNNYTTNKALQSKATGNLAIVHAVPIFVGSQRIGLLGASLNLTKFGDEMILKKTLGKTGYPYVMDKQGMIMIHPDVAFVETQAQDLDPVFQTVIDSGDELIYDSYSLNGAQKQGIFSRMPKTGWVFALAIEDSEAFQSILILRLLLGGISVILIIGTSAILFFYVRIRLIRKLNHIEQIMSQASKGNMTKRGYVRGRDEVAGMTRYFNNFLDTLSSFFLNLRGSLQDLDEVGIDLSSNMEEAAAAVHQIKSNVENSLVQIKKQEESVSTTVTITEKTTQNIESLDRNIEHQDQTIQQGSTAIEEMIAQIKTVSKSTEEAEDLMTILNTSSSKGRNNLQNVSNQVKDIEEQSKDLKKANDLIAGIAAQTNLLSMNASIEAAHAGDAGRGFAVVADEIRKLAEQSTLQSSQVKQTISNISNSIQNVVSDSNTSNHSFEEIMENMKKMGEITVEIKSSMQEQVAGSTQVLQTLEELKNSGQEVFSGSREMMAGNKEILKAVEALKQISSEVSMAIREIGNGMNEINSSILNVTDIAEKNRSSINNVRNEAAQYQLENLEEETLNEEESKSHSEGTVDLKEETEKE
jgi:methyl-accepting chemotaxis protein